MRSLSVSVPKAPSSFAASGPSSFVRQELRIYMDQRMRATERHVAVSGPAVQALRAREGTYAARRLRELLQLPWKTRILEDGPARIVFELPSVEDVAAVYREHAALCWNVSRYVRGGRVIIEPPLCPVQQRYRALVRPLQEALRASLGAGDRLWFTYRHHRVFAHLVRRGHPFQSMELEPPCWGDLAWSDVPLSPPTSPTSPHIPLFARRPCVDAL